MQGFFESIIKFDGPTFGKAILGLAPTQPYVKSPQTFIEEVTAKMGEQREEMLNGEGRAGDNIRAYMASVRAHNVKLDPTVMVALMSMLVLEGWQFRLDPSTSIVGAIETLDPLPHLRLRVRGEQQHLPGGVLLSPPPTHRGYGTSAGSEAKRRR